MGAPNIISDSQSEVDDDTCITWNYIEAANKKNEEQIFRRQQHILKDLKPLTYDFSDLPTQRTRRHVFCQRHVYTADLSEYLNLSSREQLDTLSKNGKSDEEILYMLNRKYKKLRKFYEGLGIKRHRFKKKNFDVYLDDFKKYQTGRDGRSFYEMQDQALDDLEDQKRLNDLLEKELQDVDTTEDENEVDTDNEKVPEQLDPNAYLNDNEDASQQVIMSTNRRRGRVVEEKAVVSLLSDDKKEEEKINEAKSTSQEMIVSAGHEQFDKSRSSTFDQHFPPDKIVPVVQSFHSTDRLPSSLSSSPVAPLRVSRRTRRHKFSQDHVYVTDTAVHLGLVSAYVLNDMYDSNESYDQVIQFLEVSYKHKRDQRVVKEIGLGPFAKSTFQSYLDDENKHLISDGRRLVVGQNEQEDSMKEFLKNDNFDISDEDYVFPDDEHSTHDPNTDTYAESEDDHVFDIPSDSNSRQLTTGFASRSLISSSEPSNDDDKFMFRNRLLNKRMALHGILPASFYKVSGERGSRSHLNVYKSKRGFNADSGPLLPGIARRKKAVHAQVSAPLDEMTRFLAPDSEPIEGMEADPAEYHKVSKTLEDLKGNTDESVFLIPSDSENGSGINSDSSHEMSEVEDDDDLITVNDYDVFIDHMRDDMNMDGSAEEDNRTGMNYMLSREPRKKGVTTKKRKRPSKGSNTLKMRSLPKMTRPGGKYTKPGFHRLPSSRFRKLSARNHISSSSISHPDVVWLSEPEDGHMTVYDDGFEGSDDSVKKSFLLNNSPTTKSVKETDNKTNEGYARTYWTPRISKSGQRSERKHVRQETRPSRSRRSRDSYQTSGVWNASSFQDAFYFGRNKVNGTPQVEGTFSEPYSQCPGVTPNERLKIDVKRHAPSRNTFIDTVTKLDRAVNEQRPLATSLDNITLQMYQSLQLRSNSVVYSRLIQECLKLEGDYFKEDDTVFEYCSVRFSISSYGPFSECPGLITALLKTIQASLGEAKTITRQVLIELRKCLIRMIQLLWNLKHSSFNNLKAVGRILLEFVREQQINLKSDKLKLLCLPYHLIFMDLLHKIMRSENDMEYVKYEKEAGELERAYIILFCSMPAPKVYKYFKGGSDKQSFFFEAGCLFLSLSPNPWQYVASIAMVEKKRLPVISVVNFLYFVHSRLPVLVDWEYFIMKMDALKSESDPEKWLLVFRSILKVMQDTSWTFEEDLLVKMYRLLSSRRFENIGALRPTMLWYSTLPVSNVFLERDGCLDMYLKFLVLYVRSRLDHSREANLMERLVPIASVKTSTIMLLKNRANVMLVMSYLFRKDFLGHFRMIFKAILDFKTSESYKIILELLLALSRCYFSLFQKLPLGIIRHALPQVISAVNEGGIGIVIVAESLRNLVDCFDNQLGNGIDDPRKLLQTVDLTCIFLKLEVVGTGSRMTYIPNTILAVLKRVLEITDTKILLSMEPKLKTELVVSLKSVIMSISFKNDDLKAKCVLLWIYLSSRLNVTAGSLTYIEWQYFADSSIRTRFELPFYTALLKYYRPVDLRYLHENLFMILMKNLPIEDNHFFSSFFVALAAQGFMHRYVTFRSGLDVTKFSEKDLRHYKQQITVKILAQLVLELKKVNPDGKFRDFLTEYIKALEKEYTFHERTTLNPGKYNVYATRIVRYLYTVVGKMLQDLPEFIILKRKLSITQILSSLNEQLESVSSTNELYLLLESEYITSLKCNKFREFETDLVNYCLNNDGFIDDDQRVSPIIALSTLISSHVSLVLFDKKFWFHFGNWFSIFTHLVLSECTYNSDEIWHIIKVLTLLTKISGTSEYPSYTYHENVSIICVYRIIERLGTYLLGFEDMVEFLESIDVLRGLDSVVELSVARDLFISISNEELDKQVRKVYSESDAVLSRVVKPEMREEMIASSRLEKNEVSKAVMEYITNFKTSVDVAANDFNTVLTQNLQFL
ncbi:hypothetical protein FOA43_003306 [Brettanomyces nanus]|uniref:Uncharacterized protein n=1 Tax=Eeniella nana TaxID=13502 RepID=A0A875RQ53_EENNA|nr:uncharacterized protein FOA43_003306 [Brettanomyces nanus]QPG75920.1 hypothetical protein FOA43_003306 [Brettanomyces nanus]